MSAPIAAMLAGFAIGAVSLQACARLPSMPVAAAIIALGATVAMLAGSVHFARLARSGRLRALTIALCLAASGSLGYFYAAARAELRLADALPQAWEGRDVRVTGIVDGLPHEDADGARFEFTVGQVHTPEAIVPSRVSLGWFTRRVASGTASPPPAVHAGERWTLTLRLKRPHGNVNPNGFDLEAWLLERNLRATGYVRDNPAPVRDSEFAGRARDYVERAREHIRDRIATALPSTPYAGVLVALAIGDQRSVPDRQWRVFNRTGITHLVSISGLHVTAFALFVGACALALGRRSVTLTSHIPARKAATLCGVLAAWAYVMLAGAEVPAVRTLLMLLVAIAGLWLGRPGTAALVWLWSLVAVLVWDPWAGLAPGFWLSFGAVGLLLYAGGGRLRPAFARGWKTRCSRALQESFHAQWVVTLGLVPGTLALFQQVSLVSMLANAVAIPMVTAVVVPLALVGIVVPIDAPWIVAHAAFALLMLWLEWLSALPYAAWASYAPRPWSIAVAVAGSLWLFAPRGVPGRALGLLSLLPLLLLPAAMPASGGARIVVLDVGQGLAVLVATAKHALLYDTGPRYGDATDAGGRIVVPFLRAAGAAKLDALVVSHADTDHSGGALSILAVVPVTRLISSLPDDHSVVAAAAATGTTQREHCDAGGGWEWDGVAFEVLHPAMVSRIDPARKSNDRSCVLRVASAGGTVLLTGDIEALSERELLARNPQALRAEVIVVPHHGSRTSSTRAFISAVSPQIAVIAAGYRNRFGHPRAEILARYAEVGAALPRTDLQGAIMLTLEPRAPIGAVGERQRRPRYWYDQP